MFPDETACLRYLQQLRWPGGFVCESCGTVGEPFRLATRPRVIKCRACERETSMTAGTMLHGSKTSPHVWFWAAYLVATQTSGISALELQKQLGLARYETAFQLLHKLRAAMVRPFRDPIGLDWPVEMDVTFVGGKHKVEARAQPTSCQSSSPSRPAVEHCVTPRQGKWLSERWPDASDFSSFRASPRRSSKRLPRNAWLPALSSLPTTAASSRAL